MHVIVYSNLLKIHPWVKNLSSSTKRGVGVFSRVVIFLHPLHMQLVCLVMYAVILQCLLRHAFAHGVCLHLLVRPLAPCCFFRACTAAQIGVLSRERHLLRQLHSKKEGGLIFKGGPIFGRLRYIFGETEKCATNTVCLR